MSRKHLKVLSINFDEKDNAEMRGAFESEEFLCFKGEVTGYDEAIKKFIEINPDIVAINMVDNPQAGVDIINSISKIVGFDPQNTMNAKDVKNNMPHIVAATLSDEANFLNDPKVYGRVLEFGYLLIRYGSLHEIEDVIDYCIDTAEFVEEVNELGQITLPHEIMQYLELKKYSPAYITQEGAKVNMRSNALNRKVDLYRRHVDELRRVILPIEIRQFLEISPEKNKVSLVMKNLKVNIKACA